MLLEIKMSKCIKVLHKDYKQLRYLLCQKHAVAISLSLNSIRDTFCRYSVAEDINISNCTFSENLNNYEYNTVLPKCKLANFFHN